QADRNAGRFELGALGLGRAVEEQLDRAVGQDEADTVAFEDREIRGIAQIVALPGIAIDDQRLDPALRHGLRQSLAPILRQHMPLPICRGASGARSEEHTSELQSLAYLVCRLLLEKK